MSSGVDPEVWDEIDLGMSEGRKAADDGGGSGGRSDHWSFDMLNCSLSRNESQLRAMLAGNGRVVAREMSRVDQETQTHEAWLT